MNTKLAKIILIILLIILCAIIYSTYPQIAPNRNCSTAVVGSSTVDIPDGYDIQKISNNGVLFSNLITDIGIYEVQKGSSYEKKINQLKKRYGNNSVSTYSYNINDTQLNTVMVKNHKVIIKESYFEKNGVKYHIYEKGAEDKTAFKKLFDTINDKNH